MQPSMQYAPNPQNLLSQILQISKIQSFEMYTHDFFCYTVANRYTLIEYHPL